MVIATVFLTIIAMTGGYVLGERQRNDDRSSGGGTAPSEASVQSPVPAFTPPGDWCPDETRWTSKRTGGTSELWQVLKIRADNGSTYWICEDRKGLFYYQAFTGKEGDKIIEGDNALFLTGVQHLTDDMYQAVDQRGNRFLISPTQFVLDFADPGKKTQTNEAKQIS
ncbi:hypothetical protein JIG36_49490 [Actinoplanes sp. LDG1-06]|uniref:Uncharacterized protein n=1 Tax=Paractinoplanes ovalisporus TaxID=2810368 RepID=A0ABS2AWK8_9ACTN|nr:hypothetical protein [Actinoplanes ovalisporus]MBM2623554.1 hypothetical protein [Actinoplanes ovalisporus]